MLIGYARSSTVDQKAGLEAQLDALKSVACERVFAEQVSQLEAAIGFARDGDTFVVTRLDRLARSTQDLLSGSTERAWRYGSSTSQDQRWTPGRPSTSS